MDNADCIMCVSELTRQTVINQYHQDPRKCFTVHNAVYPLRQELADIPRPDHTGKEKVMPCALAQAGNALKNSRMLLDRGWATPMAERFMKILITCSS